MLAVLFPLAYLGQIAAPNVWSPRVALFGMVAAFLGPICFAVGRQIRRRSSRLLRPRGAFHSRLRKALRAHRLRTSLNSEGSPGAPDEGGLDTPLAVYTSARSLYARMWAVLERHPQLACSRRRLLRRWSLEAIYDGLAVSLLTWAAVFWVVPSQVDRWLVSPNLSLLLGCLFTAGAVLCWSEAARAQKSQLSDLAATMAEHYAEHYAEAPQQAPEPPPASPEPSES
jgi:hypothetical protein